MDPYLSALTGLNEFVATATYSIPSRIAFPNEQVTFTTEPEWWSEVPSDVRFMVEQAATAELSIRSEAYNAAAPTGAVRAGAVLGGGLAMAAAAGAVFL